jgi:hypothetical protein
MRRLELGVSIAGMTCMVIAIGAFDWRLGLLALGAFLTVSVIDLPRTRA